MSPISSSEWSALTTLAQHSPESFEQARQQLIENAIAAAPPNKQHRLRQWQWQIEGLIKKAEHPGHACLRLTQKAKDLMASNHTHLSRLKKML